MSCFFYVLIIFFSFHASDCPLLSYLPGYVSSTLLYFTYIKSFSLGDWGFSYRIPIYFYFRKSLLRFSEILIFSQFILLLVFPFVNCSCILVCLIDKYWLISGSWAVKLKGTFKALNGVLFDLVELSFDFADKL